jgi:hypothetical protein
MGDVSTESAQRISKARQQVIEWHVVIAGHDHARTGQRVEELTRPTKLHTPRTLRQVARNGEDMRIQTPDALGEPFNRLRSDRPEVQVGQMRDRPHQVWWWEDCRGGPANTRSAFTRSR